MRDLEITKVLNAVIADTTSDPVKIAGAGKVTFVFSADVTLGNGVFTVEVSIDKVTWIPYSKLIRNLVNTNAQTLTRVASETLSTDTAVFVSMSPEDAFAFARVKVDQTTDGTYNAWVLVQK